jgi:hypothetical protein
VNIEEVLKQIPTKQVGGKSSPYETMLTYTSSGSFPVGFPHAIRVVVNDSVEYIFDVPESLGKHTKRFDLSAAIKSGEKNTVKLLVSVYDFEIVLGVVKSTAQIDFRAGRKMLFSEVYDSNLYWRRTEETLTIFA